MEMTEREEGDGDSVSEWDEEEELNGELCKAQ